MGAYYIQLYVCVYFCTHVVHIRVSCSVCIHVVWCIHVQIFFVYDDVYNWFHLCLCYVWYLYICAYDIFVYVFVYNVLNAYMCVSLWMPMCILVIILLPWRHTMTNATHKKHLIGVLYHRVSPLSSCWALWKHGGTHGTGTVVESYILIQR